VSTVERVHDEEAGVFEQTIGVPNRALAGIVLGYTGYSHRCRGSYRRREPAQDRVTLIVNFGPRLQVAGPAFEQVAADSFIAPLADTYAVTTESGSLHGLQVDLSPLGARMLLGRPMSELDDLIVDLEAVLGAEAPLLVERLFLAPGWTARFELFDAFALARVGERRPSPDVAWAWSRLAGARGRLAIGALAAELGSSRRHLNARFREQVGLGPKAVARIMRFRHAAELIAGDDGHRFAEIAQACGYCDQPHLNRDFRELAGTTPGAYVANSLPPGFGVAA
jgi:AraC-like DNA-binding protein